MGLSERPAVDITRCGMLVRDDRRSVPTDLCVSVHRAVYVHTANLRHSRLDSSLSDIMSIELIR